MKLDFFPVDEASLFPPSSSSEPAFRPNAGDRLQSGQWVKLRALPNPFSFDEALLLCPCAEQRWLAWVPDHGEVVLDAEQLG